MRIEALARHRAQSCNVRVDRHAYCLLTCYVRSRTVLAMSLRLRLFLAFAILLAVFAAILLLGLLRLNRDLKTAFAESAVEVGHTIVTVLTEKSDGKGPMHRIERHIEQRTASTGAVAEEHREQMLVLPPPHIADAAPAHAEVVPKLEGRDEALTADLGTRTEPQKLMIRRLHVDDGSQALWVSGDGIDEAIPLPQSGLNRALLGYSENLLWGVLGLLLLGLLVAFWLAHRITAPLRSLSDAAGALAAGQLGVQATAGGAPEVHHTITTFNRMSSQLADLQRQADHLRERKALTELGEIGRGLAHALRNPLHAVGLAVEELADQCPGDAQAARLHDTARAQLNRIDQALRGFLALAAGEAALETEVGLRDLVEDVLMEASQTGGGKLSLHLEDGPEIRVRGVPAELRILLHSLIINAVEAGPAGSTVRVEIDGSDPEEVRVAVRDQGAGVAHDIREQLFQPHVSSKPDGAGMGLYLAQRLAALRYGGRIELSNVHAGEADEHGTDAHGCVATLHLSSRGRA